MYFKYVSSLLLSVTLQPAFTAVFFFIIIFYFFTAVPFLKRKKENESCESTKNVFFPLPDTLRLSSVLLNCNILDNVT